MRFGHLLAQRRLQPVYALLQKVVLAGQNFGFASDFEGSGERAALHWMAQQRLGNVTVFDGGANTGDYTAEVLRAFGPRAVVHCFEPSATAFTELARRYSGTSTVHLYPVGLSNEPKRSSLYGDHLGSSGYSLHPRNLHHLDREFHEVETVTLRTIDDICHELGVLQIDLLKLDIEGHELAALEGARNLLDSCSIWAIQFELGGANIDSRTYFRDYWRLLSPHYTIHRILWDGLIPINRYAENVESFAGANYLAVLRQHS